MAMPSNNLNGFLQVYAQEALKQLIANAPLFGSFTTDFSNEIANGGSSVITRIPSTTYTANDTAANGYKALPATASSVTVTLKQRDITHDFTELDWTTATSDALIRTFLPSQVQSLCNTIVVDGMALITTGSYSTKWTAATPTAFSASAAFRVAQLLSTNKAPYTDRTLVVLPTYYEGVINGVYQQYVYGSADPVQNYRATNLAGFRVQEFASVPTVDGGLVGFAAHKSGIAAAMRAPAVINNGLVSSENASDVPSGLTVQARIAYDQVQGVYKLSTVAIYGVARGNTAAIVPIVSA